MFYNIMRYASRIFILRILSHRVFTSIVINIKDSRIQSTAIKSNLGSIYALQRHLCCWFNDISTVRRYYRSHPHHRCNNHRHTYLIDTRDRLQYIRWHCCLHPYFRRC